MTGRPSLKEQEEIVNESHRHATRNEGGGRGRCREKRKANTKNEKKNNTEDVKNHLNPGHNSGNASCATKEWPDYPDQPRLWKTPEFPPKIRQVLNIRSLCLNLGNYLAFNII